MDMARLPLQLDRPRVGSAVRDRVEAASVRRATVESGTMAFAVFLVLNAVLIVRPREFISVVRDVPMYECLVAACFLLSWKNIQRQFTSRAIQSQPITACVYGLLCTIVVSQLAHLYLGGAWAVGQAFAKVVVYYTLIVAIVNSPRRLQQYMHAIAAMIAVTAVIAMLQYRGVIDIAAFEPWTEKGGGDSTGAGATIYVRLRGIGVFNDPNDYSLVLVLAMLIAIRGIIEAASIRRWFWICTLGVVGYAFALTQSRGGFLALLISLLLLFRARFGWKRAFLIGVLIVPCLLVLLGARQTQLSTDTETGQGRMQLWWEGFDLFVHSPVFGVGAGELVEHLGYVAHNSFVHAFTELGFLGGMCFLGAYYTAGMGLHGSKELARSAGNAGAERLRSYLLAIVAGYAVGLLSLSRVYAEPTYIPLGMATAYLSNQSAQRFDEKLRSAGRYLARLVLVGVVFVVTWFVVTRAFVRWSGA
jgi:hypothetical protein